MLTAEELKAIEDQLGAEELIIKKMKNYSSQLGDPQLKTCCDQIIAQHKKHYNTLLNHLQ
ncbi:MAG: spore coat protein [Clostridia bacterium]|nr:spore coat protein [Clostridia bacterium]MBR3955300.1 spore coat protein [Clostridia bacterium]